MYHPKNDAYYKQKMEEALRFIICHTEGITEEDLGRNEVLLDSMLFRLIQVSENAQKLSEEYKLCRPKIPWKAIYGLRNRIVHDYGNTDLGVVYATLTEDIPALLEELENEA